MKYPYYATFDGDKCEIAMYPTDANTVTGFPSNAVLVPTPEQQLQLVAWSRDALITLANPTDAAKALHRLLYGVTDGDNYYPRGAFWKD